MTSISAGTDAYIHCTTLIYLVDEINKYLNVLIELKEKKKNVRIDYV